MSMMKTLARVAAGVVLAKGLSTAMDQRHNAPGQTGPAAGQRGHAGGRRSGGGLLGQLGGGSAGGIGAMLSQVLGGGHAGHVRAPGGTSSGGGLGGMLDRLTGGASGQQHQSGRTGGAPGGLIGGAAGGVALDRLVSRDSQPHNDASFGSLFNDAILRNGEPETAPTPEQNATAALMLRAMIQSAKADGRIDDAERERLTGQLGDVDEDDKAFIRAQMAAPVDAEALARDVPTGLESQVYLMSLMAIDLDSEAEARYLHALAEAMGLDRDTVNAIHDELGVVALYK